MAQNFKISELQALGRDPQDNDRFVVNDGANTTSQNTRYINYSDLKSSIGGDSTTNTGGSPTFAPVFINWNGSRARTGSSVAWPAGTVSDTQWDANSTRTRRTAVPLVYNPPAEADRLFIHMWFNYNMRITSMSALTVQARQRLLFDGPGLEGISNCSTTATHPGWTGNPGKLSMQTRWDNQLFDVPARSIWGSSHKMGALKMPLGTSSINLFDALSVTDQAIGGSDTLYVGFLKVMLLPYNSADGNHPDGLATTFGRSLGAGAYFDDENEDEGLFTEEDLARGFSDAIKRRMKKDLDLITQFSDEFPALIPYKQAILDFRTDGSNYLPEVAHQVYMDTISLPIYEIVKFDFSWAPSVRDELSGEYLTPRGEF